jgi:hypothetical protein
MAVVDAAKKHAAASVDYRLGKIAEADLAGHYNKLVNSIKELEKS